MDAQQYLTEIKVKLVASSVVTSVTILEEHALPDRGYFRARLTLGNGDFLEVAEYFVVEEANCVTKRYRYQWMDESQQVLRKRWDNVEHFPELPNFPHHVHIGETSQVEPGKLLSILELIDMIEQEIG
jgi:hypothetical protein